MPSSLQKKILGKPTLFGLSHTAKANNQTAGNIMNREPKKYTVNITKEDGMKSIYFVLSLSAGAAEGTCLREVYLAKYALAVDGWPDTVETPDLFSRGVSIVAVQAILVANRVCYNVQFPSR